MFVAARVFAVVCGCFQPFRVDLDLWPSVQLVGQIHPCRRVVLVGPGPFAILRVSRAGWRCDFRRVCCHCSLEVGDALVGVKQ